MEHDRAGGVSTLVLLDQQLESLGNGLDLGEVSRWGQQPDTAVAVRCVPAPGHRMSDLAQALTETGATRLVLGLAAAHLALGEVQSQARLAGLDPLGIEVVDLGTHAARVHPRAQATDKAKLLLAAATARAQAFLRSRPEMAKPHLPTQASRRFLFGLGHLEYRPVPWIEPERCAAEVGCQLCVEACPADCLTATHDGIQLNKAACVSCGLCLTACPNGSVRFASQEPAQWAAQLAALLGPDLRPSEPRGIFFYCQHQAGTLESLAQAGWSYPPEWLPVPVPCVGMLSPPKLLESLARGAAAVAVLSCASNCPTGGQSNIEASVSFCRELLLQLGHASTPVRLGTAAPNELDQLLASLADHPGRPAGVAEPTPATVVEQPPRVSTNGYAAASPAGSQHRWTDADVLLAVARNAPSAEPGVALAHPASPFGVVDVTPGCTGCGACAESCPTQALVLEQHNGTTALTFDSGLCTACGQCLTRCPEAAHDVIQVRPLTDLKRIAQGRTTIYQDETRRCETCGEVVGTAAMLDRVSAMLGPDYPATTDLITRYCAACRGATVAPRVQAGPRNNGAGVAQSARRATQ